MEYILNMEDINKSFPGVKALSNVSINLKAGEVHALVGENGAGKSTLMKIMSGVYQPDSGKIEVNGKEVKIENTKKAQALGISIVFQEFNLCNDLTVADNIFIGRHKTRLGLVDDKWVINETQKIMQYMRLDIKPTSIVKMLSVAEKQLVEIAKAVSIDAKIIVFDEPTAALTDNEIDRLFEIIRTLKESGHGIFYISHRLEELDKIADRVTVLRDGRYITTRNRKDITKNELIRLMVGRELINQYPERDSEIGDLFFEIKEIKKNKVFDIKDIKVRKNEIVGFAGLVGAGRTETARAIFGADLCDVMDMYIASKKITVKSPLAAIDEGIGYLTDDRKENGLALRLDIEKNINMASYKQLTRNSFYSQHMANKNAEKYIKEINIKTPSINQIALHLSGGNQQKVVLAKWLCKGCKLLIFDEPTRGIDVGAKYEIYKLMRELCRQGMGIIVISSDLPEILGMCDRTYIFYRGQITGCISADDISQEKVLECATNVKNDFSGRL